MTDGGGSDAYHGPPRRQRDRDELARDILLALLASGATTSPTVAVLAYATADAFTEAAATPKAAPC